MIIRLYTEDKNPSSIKELVGKRFDGFTLYRGVGCWKGQLEDALVIEISVDENNPGVMSLEREKYHARKLAAEIKTLNAQQAVLIEFIPSTSELV